MNTNMMSCPTCDYAERISHALDLAFSFGQTDGAHHKAWVIDRMVRALLLDDGDDAEYQHAIESYCKGEDGPNTYEWDKGVAP